MLILLELKSCMKYCLNFLSMPIAFQFPFSILWKELRLRIKVSIIFYKINNQLKCQLSACLAGKYPACCLYQVSPNALISPGDFKTLNNFAKCVFKSWENHRWLKVVIYCFQFAARSNCHAPLSEKKMKANWFRSKPS